MSATTSKSSVTDPNIASSKLSSKKGSQVDLTPQVLSEIREAFELFDPSCNGFIESKELKVVLRALGINLSREELKHMLTEADKDGKVYFQEFSRLVSPIVASRDPHDELTKAFNLFDVDSKGKISFEDLKRVAAELGEPIDNEELKEMIEEADRDGDGMVNQAEFNRMMRKTTMFQ